MAETPAAAVVWTGASGQGDGSNSGAASVLNSPHIKIEQPKNPYEDIAKDILAQRAKDELAKAKSEKEASELLFKLQGELKLDNLTDYYQKEGNKEIELMSNELGRMKAEGVSMDKITDRQREFKRKLQGLDNQMKQIDTTYNKWIEKGAQITDPKYNKPQYERVMTDVNRLIDEGDMEAVLEYTRDPKNQPLILNLDSGEWIKNMGIDDKMTDQQLNDLVDVGLANDLKAGGDEVQTFMSQGYGTNAEEVAKNLKAEARKRYPYNPPKVSTSSSGGGEDKRDLEVTASYNNAFPTEKGKTNTVTFTPKNQNMKPVVLFDGQNQYIATGQLSIHPSKDGKSYVIEADVYDKDAVAEDVPIDPNTGKPDTAALLTSLVSKGSSKKRMTFPIDHRPGETGNENYKILSDRAPQEIQNYIGRDIGGDEVKATGKSGVVEITTKEEFEKLPKGTEFIYKGQRKIKG
jgi:hypothetical protein